MARSSARSSGDRGRAGRGATWDQEWNAGQYAGGRSASAKKGHRGIMLLALALVLVVVPAVVVFGVWPRLQTLGGQESHLFPWASSTQQTAANPANVDFASQKDAVDPGFQAYYAAHNGSATLGTPLTSAIPTSAGVVQFYTSGALFAPGATKSPAKAGTASGDTALQLVETGPAGSSGASSGTAGTAPAAATGTPGSASGTAAAGFSSVVALPVVAALLKMGATVPVADGASTSYVDLRAAAMPSQLVSGSMPSPLPTTTTQPVFIATDTQGGRSQGHTIPPALWAYINSPSVSPAGWQTDIGIPLTEAQTLTATQSGATHHLLVQAFWNAVLVADADTLSGTNPTIGRASIGLDYLRTLGPPTPAIAANTQAWVLGDSAVLDAAVSGKETVHVGQNFPVTLSGQATWNKAALWYAISWTAAKQSGKGWLAGASLTFAAPDASQPSHAALDVLSPDLAAFLNQQGNNMAVAVYDVSRNAYYAYNDSQPITLASTAKVYLLLAYLDWVEGQNRSVRDDEVGTLTDMIEHSDNNAAQLAYIRIGYDEGEDRFFHKIGIKDFEGCPGGWGCAEMPAKDMARALWLLQQGKILNSSDRQLALRLMANIEPDQRWGVGDTAPKGATYSMKDGWLPDNDHGGWILNSVGIVTVSNETYVIVVYSQAQPGFDWSKVNHVCGTVAQLLTS